MAGWVGGWVGEWMGVVLGAGRCEIRDKCDLII